MDMTIRAMTPEERNYCYSQSQQISMQTGLIGHLRGDMGSNGKGFFSTFFDFRADLKTEDFKGAFDNVINALRFDENYGGVLKDRSALAAYCRRTPESSFGGDGREYGFRVDTEQYSYMLRLNPNRGEYNLYCYCYVRQWLDRHLHHAEKGIRFITPDYKEKFRIDDGDKIRITVPFPVSWTVKMKKKQKETQDILSYHTQAAGCSDKARAKASGGRQPIEECGRTGL